METPVSPKGDGSTFISVAECRLLLSRPVVPAETPKLRGFFGRRFSDALLLHHHRPDGTLLYTYPKVQFKVISNTAILLGLGEGAELLKRLWTELDAATLGSERVAVLETRFALRREPIGEAAQPIGYRFQTPWLALNQSNHGEFSGLATAAERARKLESVLVGNLLSLAKAFGHNVRVRLSADCSGLRLREAHLKGVPMQAFQGPFRVNFRIPALAGLGKSVSRGFGVVQPVDGETAR